MALQVNTALARPFRLSLAGVLRVHVDIRAIKFLFGDGPLAGRYVDPESVVMRRWRHVRVDPFERRCRKIQAYLCQAILPSVPLPYGPPPLTDH